MSLFFNKVSWCEITIWFIAFFKNYLIFFFTSLTLHAVWILGYVMWLRQTHLHSGNEQRMGKVVYDVPQRRTRMAPGSVQDLAQYLVLLGDVLLVILLHLPELGLQAAELDLHLLHVLQVPLGSLVQHLDGLGHVLDLRWQIIAIGQSNETHL